MPNGKARYRRQVGKQTFSQNVSQHTRIKRHSEFVERSQKRAEKMRTGGKIPYTWEWAYEDQYGTVNAHCKSDARAKIKEVLGLSKKVRLPIEVQIERIEFNELT